jgi:hypothetical protein
MKWLWTWSGISFGYRQGDDLRTHDGRHVGRFHGDEVYGPDGHYLGELKNENRLITSLSKSTRRHGAFGPYAQNVAYAPYASYVGYVMYAGYTDFPSPEEI